MIRINSLLIAGLAIGALVASADAALVITGASTPVSITNFSNLTPARGEIASVSSSQQGGVWVDTETNAIATVGSGTTSTPFFELAITNSTGVAISSLSITGSRIQFKDNSSNLNETLAATITGISGQTVSGLNVAAVSNNGDSSSTVNSPPLTAPYSASISNFSLPNGGTVTIRWTDTNDGGTDALFGLSNLNVAVPEPASLGLIGMTGLGLLARRRRA